MPQLIDTHETFNFRDFGGYTLSTGEEVRPGVLFRSGSLDRIADTAPHSQKDSLSIQTIIDLRHPDEFNDNSTRGSLVDLVPNRYSLSVIDATQALNNHIEALNIAYGMGQSGPRYFALLENGETIWREVIQILLEPYSYPILAHALAQLVQHLIILLLDLFDRHRANSPMFTGLRNGLSIVVIVFLTSKIALHMLRR